MPVTITSASHGAEAHKNVRPVENTHSFLNQACPQESRSCVELLQPSFDGNFIDNIEACSNGFVDGVIRAYNRHHHLRIRPEDVWFAILSQLSFYINNHAEELREHFVEHKGKKELTVRRVAPDRHTVDYGVFAQEMTDLIADNLVDPALKEWIIPNFSTTTLNDKIVASVLLMGITKKYFLYIFELMCGIPSVTLLGNKADWELIY